MTASIRGLPVSTLDWPNAPWAGRLWVTPHLGWATVEARARLVAEAAENLRAFIAGERRNRVD